MKKAAIKKMSKRDRIDLLNEFSMEDIAETLIYREGKGEVLSVNVWVKSDIRTQDPSLSDRQVDYIAMHGDFKPMHTCTETDWQLLSEAIDEVRNGKDFPKD